ncbi:HAD family hydrolase [Microbacterium sp. B35-04]|uniref:HAD family hydrolase n=1 Tax=Microbacterium sp. B35-04 TaxID=1961716 RepID=UPI001954FDE0|nr:HAD family hydrolase [Microbacterium sp. B35-04]
MATVRGVGFDLDGTLFDHHGSASRGLDEFVVSLGVKPTPQARAVWFAAEEIQFERWRAGEISFQEQRRERLRSVLPALGVQPPAYGAELDDLFEHYARAYRSAWQAYPDSVRLIHELRSAGLRVGVLTNGTEEQQLNKLKAIGLLDSLDVVCTSERIGAQKPAPHAFRAFAEELGVSTEECLFVGDNAEHDVAGARAAGMRALLIDRRGDHADGIAASVYECIALDH